MATIKGFIGKVPPILKKGELATDGNAIFIGKKKGRVEKFINKKRIVSIIEDEIKKQMDEHILEYHS